MCVCFEIVSKLQILKTISLAKSKVLLNLKILVFSFSEAKYGIVTCMYITLFVALIVAIFCFWLCTWHNKIKVLGTTSTFLEDLDQSKIYT